MNKKPLLDTEFLKKLFKDRDREIFGKVVALNVNEEPVEEITGRITTGSISIDGASAVRRTCSLTMLADSIELTDYYWGFKTRIKLFIGMTNHISKEYPDVIWFPMGVFVLTTFNSSQSTSGITVTLNGKDKMCLLNGEISGSIHAYSTRFDVIDTIDENDNYIEEKLTIREIIEEAVHGHANIPKYNIIINDLDEDGLELLEYRGSTSLFLLIDPDTSNIEQIIPSNSETNFWWNGGKYEFKDLSTLEGFRFKQLLDNAPIDEIAPSLIRQEQDAKDSYAVAQLTYGDTAGYRLTELTYPGELVANVGESITSAVLDKIVSTLGNYEYFFDIQGRFIFQKKQTYINTSWNTYNTDSNGEVYIEAAAYSSPLSWSFEGNKEVVSISNTPTLTNLKNDFSIWGTREGIGGTEIPIHLRYAVDKKPTKYVSFQEDEEGKTIVYVTDKQYAVEGSGYTCEINDYRELIYQMAIDYRKYNHSDEEFIPHLIEKNPEMCARGRTGYEQYYIDMEGFWRQIYDPDGDSAEYDEDSHWHVDVFDNPNNLNFWIEFLDTDGEIAKYSIPAVGDRAKVESNKDIHSVYYKDTPLVIYYEDKADIGTMSGYSYAQLNNLDSLFSISSQGQSALDELNTLLYNYVYCTETASVTALPVYTLQPNTLISIKDDENININGEYIVSKITYSLGYNGNMTISATKVPDTIL